MTNITFFDAFFLSTPITSIKYLFPLLPSMYPSTLSIIRYTINIYIAKIFHSNIPNVINNDIFV